MCGIAGFYDQQLDAGERNQMIAKMLSSMAHRGPDARKSLTQENLTLGHNRLSIIDLTDDANQPMPFGNLTLVFNGEIYNYREIRQSLEQMGKVFRTSSDSEVILAAYEAWGAACVDRFVGMWAFAIWDHSKKELFCSRDRFGIKPFYYFLKNGNFYFASETKALHQTGLVSKNLNARQIGRFLQMGWVTYGSETVFEEISQLPAAHNGVFHNGQWRTDRYWDIVNKPKWDGSFEEAREIFHQKFHDSIRLHTRSDVEIGCSLSGGLDSSAVASAVGSIYPDLQMKTFSIYYTSSKGMDERSFAQSVVEKYPKLQPHYLEPSAMDVADALEHITWVQDFPIGGSSFFSQYFVMKLAHKHRIKVVLDGQGSDEYLIGYLRSFYRLIANELPKPSAFRLLAQHAQREGFGPTERIKRLAKSLASKILDEQGLAALEYKKLLPLVAETHTPPFLLENKDHKDRVDNFLYHLLYHTELPHLLHYQDRNSMAFSIESRVPFLDHRLVDFTFSIPTHYKVHQGITKYILREAMKNELPLKVYARTDKKGFVSPGETQWLRGSLGFLLDMPLQNITGVHTAKARKIIDDYRRGNNRHAKLVWRLAHLNYWYSSL